MLVELDDPLERNMEVIFLPQQAEDRHDRRAPRLFIATNAGSRGLPVSAKWIGWLRSPFKPVHSMLKGLPMKTWTTMRSSSKINRGGRYLF